MLLETENKEEDRMTNRMKIEKDVSDWKLIDLHNLCMEQGWVVEMRAGRAYLQILEIL